LRVPRSPTSPSVRLSAAERYADFLWHGRAAYHQPEEHRKNGLASERCIKL
jgi:hypothetical protein